MNRGSSPIREGGLLNLPYTRLNNDLRNAVNTGGSGTEPLSPPSRIGLLPSLLCPFRPSRGAVSGPGSDDDIFPCR